MTGGLKPNK